MGIIEKIKTIPLDFKDLFRPVLSDRSIIEYNKKGLLILEPLGDYQIQPNSIDLTLANTWKKIKSNTGNNDIIDTRSPILYREGTFNNSMEVINDKNCYIIKPREFVLMASRETLNIPSGIISFVQGRSSIARLGIQTEQAGLIDSGFCGTITFEVYNQSNYPIALYEGTRLAQVYFFKAQFAKRLYGLQMNSKYNNQLEATGSKIHMDAELHN